MNVTVTEANGIYTYYLNGLEFYRDIDRYNFVALFTNDAGQVIPNVQKTRRVKGEKDMNQHGYFLAEVVAL
jgi:hypothetical protein